MSSISILTVHWGTKKTATWVSRATGLTGKWIWAKTPFKPWHPLYTSQFWGRFISAQKFVYENLNVSLSPVHSHSDQWLQVTLTKTGGRFTMCSYGSFSRSKLKGSDQLFTQGLSICFLTPDSRVLTQVLFSLINQVIFPKSTQKAVVERNVICAKHSDHDEWSTSSFFLDEFKVLNQVPHLLQTFSLSPGVPSKGSHNLYLQVQSTQLSMGLVQRDATKSFVSINQFWGLLQQPSVHKWNQELPTRQPSQNVGQKQR